MKTKTKKKEKDFDTVSTFRRIKEQISLELEGKTFEEIKEFLKLNSLKLKEK